MSKKTVFVLTVILLIFLCSIGLSDSIQVEGESVLNGTEYYIAEAVGGFSIPVFFDDSMWQGGGGAPRDNYIDGGYWMPFSSDIEDRSIFIEEYINFFYFQSFYEDASKAELELPFKEMLEEWLRPETEYKLVENELIQINDHPARLAIWLKKGTYYHYYCDIAYIRNDRGIVVSFTCEDSYHGKITMDDLHAVANLILYDESRAPYLASDCEFTISTKDGTSTITAGQKAQIVINYRNPEKANIKIKRSQDGYTKAHGLLEWTVMDSETQNIVESGISVDSNGTIATDKSIDKIQKVIIKAKSNIYESEAELPLIVIPTISSIVLDKEELLFYEGTNTPETVKVTLEPETVPPIGLTWKAQKEGIVEIIPNDDGTASLKPLSAGKTVITIIQPSGKKARLNVSVIVPVEQINLALSGKQIPGGKVSVKETLIPKNIGNKKVEWALNVDENVATINEKGQITISKEVAAGTKIVVTCKALGAPKPVVATVEFEVREK